jgi:hypothetical protein
MKQVFLSHISEESPMARPLKKWIEDAFPGECRVFVSSSETDLPVGTKWFDAIEQALDRSDVLLVLCSHHSVSRPWVNFEAGCAWTRRVPIIPICHSGLRKADLPQPLSQFQSLELDEPEFSSLLLSGLVRMLGVTPTQSTREEDIKELRAFQHLTVEAPKTTSRPKSDTRKVQRVLSRDEIESASPDDIAFREVEFSLSETWRRFREWLGKEVLDAEVVSIRENPDRESSFYCSGKPGHLTFSVVVDLKKRGVQFTQEYDLIRDWLHPLALDLAPRDSGIAWDTSLFPCKTADDEEIPIDDSVARVRDCRYWVLFAAL